MNDLGKVIFKRIQEATKQNGGKLGIHDLDLILATLLDSVKGYISTETELSAYSAIEHTLNQLKEAKTELQDFNPAIILPEATKELNEVTKATEQSTNTILEAAETIQKLVSQIGNKELETKINQEITKIFEACNFQDITGQRISKVSSIIGKMGIIMERLVGKMSGTTSGRKKEKTDQDLLNGPQLTENTPSQDDIDNLFNS